MAQRSKPPFRPTEAQLVKSQKRIAKYVTALRQPYNIAARNLEITERALKQFMFGGTKNVLKNYPRSKSTQKLFRASINYFDERVEDAQGILVPKRVPRFKGPIAGVEPYVPESGDEDQERKYKRLTQSIRQGYELPRLGMENAWAKYTSARGLPTSIEEIKELYADGEFNTRTATSILSHWHSIYYDMTDDWYEGMVEEFDAYSDYGENAA